MAANKRKKKTYLLALILIVCALVVLGVIVFSSKSKPKATSSHTSTPISKPTTTNILTAGGQPVPKAWQAKAKALGYYCPSWDAQPGQISSDICLPLDKTQQ
jgi:hypothetical protein